MGGRAPRRTTAVSRAAAKRVIAVGRGLPGRDMVWCEEGRGAHDEQAGAGHPSIQQGGELVGQGTARRVKGRAFGRAKKRDIISNIAWMRRQLASSEAGLAS